MDKIEYVCIKLEDDINLTYYSKRKPLDIGNKYLITNDESYLHGGKEYYIYNSDIEDFSFKNCIAVIKEKQFKKMFITLAEWREKQIMNILTKRNILAEGKLWKRLKLSVLNMVYSVLKRNKIIKLL